MTATILRAASAAIAAAVVFASHSAAAAAALCEAGGPAGTCPAGAAPTPDHAMLQVWRGVGFKDDDERSWCGDMPDVKRRCSTNGCRVLAATNGRSCREYCDASGRDCVTAWEEVSDDCAVKFQWNCDQPLPGTSDLICKCAPKAAPVEDPAERTCPGMPDVKRSCSASGCRVLAETRGRSCAEYCGSSGRACVGAWEDVQNECVEEFAWRCDEPLAGTSDLICECVAGAAEPPPVPAPGTPPAEAAPAPWAPTPAEAAPAPGALPPPTAQWVPEIGAPVPGAVVPDQVPEMAPAPAAPEAGPAQLAPQAAWAPDGAAPAAPVKVPGLVWSDEFDGGVVDGSKWDFEHGGGGFGNYEAQYYSSRNAEVRDGVLRITARCEEYKGERYTSAKLMTRGRAQWGPGHRVEVRARLPKGRGTWPAIWMLPADEVYGKWPHSGEIDITESVGCEHDTVHGTVHTGEYNHLKHTEKTNKMYVAVGDWHTYTVEWGDREIRWLVDGQPYHTFAPQAFDSERWPFDQQFYLILNVAVGGSWGGWCVGGGPSCSAADEFGQEQVMEVDYARVFSLR